MAITLLAALGAAMDASSPVRIFRALLEEQCAILAEDLALVNMQKNGTRWLSAAATPKTPLEHAAAAIFAKHTAGRAFDKKISGAEYWVQSHVQVSRKSGNPSGGIHLHRDFDLGALERDGRSDVHPAFSTITYLTSSPLSMSTIIFTNFTKGRRVGESVMREAVVVHPAAGKHVAFDGSAWHGVAPPLVFSPGVAAAATVGRPGARRVTLLVNVWLDHVPGVQRGSSSRPGGEATGGEEGSDANDLVDMPSLSLFEMDAWKQERWEHSTDGWVRSVPGNEAGGAEPTRAEPGELALALMMDKKECSGVKIWLPHALVSGGARGTSLSRVTFREGGQRMEYEANLCVGMARDGDSGASEAAGAGEGAEAGAQADSGKTAAAVAEAAEAADADFQAAQAMRATDMKASMALVQRAAAKGHVRHRPSSTRIHRKIYIHTRAHMRNARARWSARAACSRTARLSQLARALSQRFAVDSLR